MTYVGEEIYKILPIRYPLMLLQELTVEEDKAVSYIRLRGDEWFFDCHFPGLPIMPLSLIIESMSETFISIFLHKIQKPEITASVSLGGKEKISLKDKLEPGDTLRIEASLKSFRRGVAQGGVKAYKNDGEFPIIDFELVEVLPSQMVKMPNG